MCRVHVSPRGISEENKETTTQEEVGEEQVLFEEVQDELELVELRPLISMAQKGGVEKIVNLPGVLWMKFEKKELFRDSIAVSFFFFLIDQVEFKGRSSD